jgi:hypothetical protein
MFLSPSGEFHQAITFPLFTSLAERQPACCGEYSSVVDGNNVNLGVILLRHLKEAIMAKKSPGRYKRQIIVDGFCHEAIPIFVI